MIGYVSTVTGTLVGAAIPSQLIVEPTRAWAVVLVLLAVCCLLLWFLAKPVDIGLSPTSAAARAGHERRRLTPPRRQQVQHRRRPLHLAPQTPGGRANR